MGAPDYCPKHGTGEDGQGVPVACALCVSDTIERKNAEIADARKLIDELRISLMGAMHQIRLHHEEYDHMTSSEQLRIWKSTIDRAARVVAIEDRDPGDE